jgi:hypothetical protein
MKNQIKSVESILAKYGFEVDDFFIISFWKTSGEIAVQSHFSSEMFEKCKSLIDKDFRYTVSANIHQFVNEENHLRISLS